MSRFYITTPIYYINAEPHLGHAYTTMVADAVARAHRLMGDEVFFLTGTDEHGQKVARAAEKAGLDTKAFADATAQKFKDLWPRLNISNDDFIRTTEPRHYAAAQALWRRVRDRGFIYKGKYEGWYCTVDEVFIPETQLQNGTCPLCGNNVERIAEESYFFKLSAFQQPLLDLFRQDPEFVIPGSRRNEVLSFVEAGLEDLSVSRTSFKWGIPVPDDPAHVMYVWFDALTNYMTAAGYPQDEARFARWWVGDEPGQRGRALHLVGKEIIRQHAVYWPAFLLAADLPLPRQIVSHGWWTMDGAKMSKSKGNVVRPQVYVDRFGLDAFRYFVFREMNFGQDAEFTDESFVGRYNADLANDLGNLVSRATTMIHRYCGGVVPAPVEALLAREVEANLARATDRATVGIDGNPPAVAKNALSFQLSWALREIWNLIGEGNRYLVARAPWTLAKDPAKRGELETTLYVAADLVRVIGELIRPFVPDAGERTLKMLGLTPQPASWRTLKRGDLTPGTKLGETVALFPRIEQTVEELQQMSNPSTPAPDENATEAIRLKPDPTTSSQAPQAPAPAPGTISYDDFMKTELRVAKVLAAERVPKSKRLLKLVVDAGTEQRTIVAGIAEAYEPETLVGRSVAIVFNLAPAKLMGIESQGMVLAGSPEGGKPQIVTFDDPPPPPGSRVR